METHNFGFFIIFQDQHFENGLREAIYTQIFIHIRICYKDVC